MVDIAPLVDVATAIAKAGIKDDSAIAAILERSGFMSDSATVDAVKTIAKGIPSAGNITAGVVGTSVRVTGRVAGGVGDVTKGMLEYVTATPTRRILTFGTIAGITAVGGYEVLTARPGGSGGSNSGSVSKNSDGSTTPAKNYGILGTAIQWFATGLLGTAPEDVANTVSKAIPWVEGGIVILGIVGVGYFVNSLRSSKHSAGRRAYR